MKKTLPLLLVICIMLSLCSCRTTDNPGEYPVTVGNIVISEKPNGAVCLSDSAADIVIACGYSTSLAARSENCDQNAIFPLPTVGTIENPDINAIINTGCTLVLADSRLSQENKKLLTEQGITVVSLTAASTRDELTRMYSNICAIFEGNVTGRANAERKVENLFTSIDELGRQIPDSQIINTACYIYDVDGDNIKLVTGDSFGSKLIEYTNATNVGAGAADSTLDVTTFKMQNPKFIFCAPGVKQKLEAHETLKNLQALSTDSVFELEATAMTRQGNTILSTVEFMVVSMYPELAGNYSDNDKNKGNESKSSDEDTDSSAKTNSDTSSDAKDTDSQSSNTNTSSDSGKKYRVNSDDGLSLRSSPDKTDNIILAMQDKDIVTLIEDNGNGWFKVKTEDGTVGYCSSEFLVEE